MVLSPKNKSEIKAIGKRMTGHKTTGANGSGTMTLYYMTPIFRAMLRFRNILYPCTKRY